MNKKDLLKDIGYRLKKIRDSLNYSPPGMASRLGIARSSYTRNENGKTCPAIHSMRVLANSLDISLDWFICEKGPMFYSEKQAGQPAAQPEKPEVIPAAPEQVAEAKPIRETPEPLPEEIRELVEHMQRIPLLRYEILAAFHLFKDQHKNLVAV